MIIRSRVPSALLFLAVAWGASAARGQDKGPGQADPLPGNLTADQIRRALQGFPTDNLPDIPPDLLDLVRDRMQKEGKQAFNDRQFKEAMEKFRKDDKFREQVENLGRKLKQGGKDQDVFTPKDREEFKDIARRLQQAMPQNVPQPNLPANPMNVPPPQFPPKDVPPPNNVPQPNNVPPPMPVPPPQIKPDPLRNLDPNGKGGLDRGNNPNEKAAQAAASLWERNIGPLDETPAVKSALFDLIEGTEDLTDSNGKRFWDDLAGEEGDASSLSKLLDDAALGESWTMPKFELGDWKLFGDNGPDGGGDGGGSNREGWWSRNFGRRSAPSTPSAPSSSGFSMGLPSFGGGWQPIAILAAILVAVLLVWRFWGVKWARNRAMAGLYGPGWPLDPRRITTREHVVIAFEYLSVLICGPTAKTWTHNTIAGALADLAHTHGETAVLLARLYELARYAPLNEPLTTRELSEARRIVCALAGLEHE